MFVQLGFADDIHFMNKERMQRLFGDDWEDENFIPNHVIENVTISNVEVVSENSFAMRVKVKKDTFCDHKIEEE